MMQHRPETKQNYNIPVQKTAKQTTSHEIPLLISPCLRHQQLTVTHTKRKTVSQLFAEYAKAQMYGMTCCLHHHSTSFSVKRLCHVKAVSSIHAWNEKQWSKTLQHPFFSKSSQIPIGPLLEPTKVQKFDPNKLWSFDGSKQWQEAAGQMPTRLLKWLQNKMYTRL